MIRLGTKEPTPTQGTYIHVHVPHIHPSLREMAPASYTFGRWSCVLCYHNYCSVGTHWLWSPVGNSPTTVTCWTLQPPRPHDHRIFCLSREFLAPTQTHTLVYSCIRQSLRLKRSPPSLGFHPLTCHSTIHVAADQATKIHILWMKRDEKQFNEVIVNVHLPVHTLVDRANSSVCNPNWVISLSQDRGMNKKIANRDDVMQRRWEQVHTECEDKYPITNQQQHDTTRQHHSIVHKTRWNINARHSWWNALK